MAGDLNDAAYREEQLKFVMNINGSSARETLLLILPSVCGLLLTSTIVNICGRYASRRLRFILEFVVVVLPAVLCCTIWSEIKVLVCSTMLVISGFNMMLALTMPNIFAIGALIRSTASDRRFTFLTNFRGLTNLLTAICILAVDFKLFPRRYAKTEVYGYSLMDTGVGFFVVSNALVSQEARGSNKKLGVGFWRTAFQNLINCIKGCIPLLALGSVRYFSVEWLGYQKQVTEYGVHWNFFITLAVVKIVATLVTTLINPRYSLVAGIMILASHEYFLNQRKFMKWLFSETREGFINSNREGIVSTVGYTALYLLGVALGRLVHSTLKSENRSRTTEHSLNVNIFGRSIELRYDATMILCMKLSLVAAQGCMATLFLDSYFRVSRRLTNSGYCTWMITLAATMLTLLVLVDVIVKILNGTTINDDASSSDDTSKSESTERVSDTKKSDSHCVSNVSEIMEALNYNGLAFFLVSNLLTGVVNMSIRTLYVEDNKALQILVSYMFFTTSIFVALYERKIQLKLS